MYERHAKKAPPKRGQDQRACHGGGYPQLRLAWLQPSLNPIGTPAPQPPLRRLQVSADTRLTCARCTRTITQSDAVFTVWLRKLSTGWRIAAWTCAKAGQGDDPTLTMRWSKATSSSPVRHRAHEVQEPPRGARQHHTNQPSARFYASVVLCWCGRSILYDCATFSRENSPCMGTSKRLKNACARRGAQKVGAQSARANRDDVKR